MQSIDIFIITSSLQVVNSFPRFLFCKKLLAFPMFSYSVIFTLWQDIDLLLKWYVYINAGFLCINISSDCVYVSYIRFRFSSLKSPSSLTLQNLSPTKDNYEYLEAYNNSKLCLILFMKELQVRIQDYNCSIVSVVQYSNMTSLYMQ